MLGETELFQRKPNWFYCNSDQVSLIIAQNLPTDCRKVFVFEFYYQRREDWVLCCSEVMAPRK
jgi:hypothetical protein